MKTNKKIELAFIVMLFLIIAFTTFGCHTIKPANRYAKNTAAPMQYPYWERSQLSIWEKVFGKSQNKDWRIRVAENQIKAYEIQKANQEKEAKILKEVQSIKSKIVNE
jgi:hypothetical protein